MFLVGLILTLQVAATQSPQVSPRGADAWIYEIAGDLRKIGVWDLPPPELRYMNVGGSTAREFAVEIEAATIRLMKILNEQELWTARARNIYRPSPIAHQRIWSLKEDWDSIKDWSEALEKLPDLTKRFSEDLRGIGVNPQDLLRKQSRILARIYNLDYPSIGKEGRPFWDVPRGHWAAGAVEELRLAGILTGYPDVHAYEVEKRFLTEYESDAAALKSYRLLQATYLAVGYPNSLHDEPPEPPTNYGLAICIHATTEHLHQIIGIPTLLGVESARIIQAAAQLKVLTPLLEPELKMLGLDPRDLLQKQAAVLRKAYAVRKTGK